MAIQKQKNEFTITSRSMTLLNYLNNHKEEEYGIEDLIEIAKYYNHSGVFACKQDLTNYILVNKSNTIPIINNTDYSFVKNDCDLLGSSWNEYHEEDIFITNDYHAFSKNDIEHMLRNCSVDRLTNPFTKKHMIEETHVLTHLPFSDWVSTLNYTHNKYDLFFEEYPFEQIHYVYTTYLKEKLYKFITHDDSFAYFELSLFDIITENTVKYIWNDISYPYFGYLGEDISFEDYYPTTVYEFYTNLSHIISHATDKKDILSSYLYVYFQVVNNIGDTETITELNLYRTIPWDILTLSPFTVTISPLLIMPDIQSL
jgi:hypothetical protein